MASVKLPTREALGALPSVRADRAIATYKPQVPGSSVAAMTAMARAQESAAESISKGITEIGKAGEAFYQKDQQQQLYDTELRFQEWKWQKQQELVERQRNAPTGAPDFADTWQKDYFEGAKEFFKTVPENFKAHYEIKLFDTERSFHEAAQKFQFGEQSRAAKIEHNETLNSVHAQRARLLPTDQLNTAIKEYESLIDLDTRLTSEEKQAQKLKARETIALSHIEGRPPEERIAILDAIGAGSIKQKLSWRESKNRPDAENQFGYAGLWQFGAPRLADVGLYKPGANENLKTWSRTGKGAPGKWSGEFNIPGFPEVKTLQDFKNNPRAQDVAYDLHTQRMDQEIAQNGFDRFIGQKVGGVDITREGLYGMLHLGGVEGARNALENGIVARDANRTSVLDYARMGTEGTGTPLDYLPREKIKALRDNARTELNAERVQREHQDVLARAERKRVSDETEAQWLQKIYTGDAEATAVAIARDSNLEVTARERMIKLLEHVGRSDRTAATYGKDFYSLFQRIHAPEGDPNRLTDPAELYKHVTEGGGLSLAGMEKLRTEMSGRRTPEGAAEAELRKQFYANAKAQISGSNEGLGFLKDPKGDELFLKFFAQSQADYEAGRKAGKSPTALLTPDSPDYIGKSITTYKRPMAQWFGDMVADKPVEKPAFDPRAVNSLDDLKKAHLAGYVTAMEARAIAVQRGWAKDRTPAAVAPSGAPMVPLSQ